MRPKGTRSFGPGNTSPLLPHEDMDTLGLRGTTSYAPPPKASLRAYFRAEATRGPSGHERRRSRSPPQITSDRYRSRSPMLDDDDFAIPGYSVDEDTIMMDSPVNQRPSVNQRKETTSRDRGRAPSRWVETRKPTLATPPTAYDLRRYAEHVYKTHYKQFINGATGKVSPSKYGAGQHQDFGLCFTTFLTRYPCEIGLGCPWRHHPLSKVERRWMVENNEEHGKKFLAHVNRCWPSPDVPLPGANMHDHGEN
ncbi:hypothetical protein ACJBU6_09320 [Exserohilum turcicum]